MNLRLYGRSIFISEIFAHWFLLMLSASSFFPVSINVSNIIIFFWKLPCESEWVKNSIYFQSDESIIFSLPFLFYFVLKGFSTDILGKPSFSLPTNPDRWRDTMRNSMGFILLRDWSWSFSKFSFWFSINFQQLSSSSEVKHFLWKSFFAFACKETDFFGAWRPWKLF